MDQAKKAELEKRAVIGLSIVFVFFFVQGPMKSLGWFHPRPQPSGATPVAEPVAMERPISVVLQEFRQKQQSAVDDQDRPSAPSTPAAYAAHDVRDPFTSLFPEPREERSPQDATAPPPVDSQPVRPAPPLRIHGLVWGGTEPKAIINGNVYGVDDVVVEGGKILSIDSNGVTVDLEGSPFVYSVPQRPKGSGGAVAQQAKPRR